jgi:glyoxylase-like metal-dependent hydrolase (beta-lactamase superfamily II)
VTLEWVTVGPFQENSYLLADPATREAVLVDPGEAPARIIRMVDAAHVTPTAIWLTHAHLDHIGAVTGIRARWDIPVLLHPLDLPLYRRAAIQAANYGLRMDQPRDPDGELQDGQVLTLGDRRFTVRHTPGHAPGHVVFLGDGVMIGGDLLFAGSIGRTDLPMSDPAAMETSLAFVAGLDPATVVYPGHGPPTTIGAELDDNPFLQHVQHAR